MFLRKYIPSNQTSVKGLCENDAKKERINKERWKGEREGRRKAKKKETKKDIRKGGSEGGRQKEGKNE